MGIQQYMSKYFNNYYPNRDENPNDKDYTYAEFIPTWTLLPRL
jgi:hypothetical protein